jgi:hypothetical protein
MPSSLFKKIVTALLLLVLGTSLQACNTLEDARMAKGTGTVRTYHASFSRTWNAAIAALASTELAIKESNKDQGYILAQRDVTLMSYGERVAIFIRKKPGSDTDVEVISKRVLETNFTAPNWTDEILDAIGQKLKEKE